MKIKMALILVLLLVFVSLYLFLRYGSIDPVKDITGCYSSGSEGITDTVCLYGSGRYEQITTVGSERKKYNESAWKSFNYTNDEGEFVAATLNDYQLSNNDGIKSVLQLDIQPYKNMSGDVVFAVGSRDGEPQKFYIRD